MNIDEYIPWDKSWIIRMGILDIFHGKSDILRFLNSQENLGDDLTALKWAMVSWKTGQPVDVGESGTLYRFLQFASWFADLKKEFVVHGTLRDRVVSNDASIVNLTQEDLLRLDNKTSQWASAAALLGDRRRIDNPPYKLALTYEAINHWQEMRARGSMWEPRRDTTIQRQANAFIQLLRGQSFDFEPQQAEDFCFAHCLFGLSVEEGEKRWPSLRSHESDRIVETGNELFAARSGAEVRSRDHRVLQAVGMWGRLNNKKVNFTFPQSVAKTWPQFWYFLAACM